ncbi:MAG: hypothetical protein HY695_24715 [Deltaproteobacteria bacterium]|nr:hypothetical protein [Deltaproteobacteria bacterium]
MSKFRASRASTGTAWVLCSLVLWGGLAWFTFSPPGGASGNTLLYVVVWALIFAFAGGAGWFAIHDLTAAVSVAPSRDPEKLVKWWYSKLLRSLGGGESFGPPWPLLFQVIKFPTEQGAAIEQENIKRYWGDFYNYWNSRLSVRLKLKDMLELRCSVCGDAGLTISMFREKVQPAEITQRIQQRSLGRYSFLICTHCDSQVCGRCIRVTGDSAFCARCNTSFKDDVSVDRAQRFTTLNLYPIEIRLANRATGVADLIITVTGICEMSPHGSVSEHWVFRHGASEVKGEWFLSGGLPELCSPDAA